MTKEIRCVIGLDAHSRICEACVMKRDGVVVETMTFRTSQYNLIKLAERFPEAAIVLEETTMAQWIFETLSPHAAEVFVSEPKRNKWITSGEKSDRLDAHRLATMYLIGSLQRVHHSLDRTIVEFKRAVQYRQSLVQALVRLKCWIKAKCREYGVVAKGVSIYHPEKREEVIGILPPAAQQRLRHVYARLDQLEQQEKEASGWMLEYSRSFKPVNLFTTVPGVGGIVACTFYAYIQTPHRFPDKHDLWSYAGLKVITPTSAGKPVGPPRLTTGGVRALKHMSRQAFLGALHANGGENALANYYRRHFHATQNATAARLVTQRKILSILLHIWKTEEAFDPNKV